MSRDCALHTSRVAHSAEMSMNMTAAGVESLCVGATRDALSSRQLLRLCAVPHKCDSLHFVTAAFGCRECAQILDYLTRRDSCGGQEVEMSSRESTGAKHACREVHPRLKRAAMRKIVGAGKGRDRARDAISGRD